MLVVFYKIDNFSHLERVTACLCVVCSPFSYPITSFLLEKYLQVMGKYLVPLYLRLLKERWENENLKMSRFFCLQNKEAPKCSRRLANNCYSIEPLGRQPTLASIPLNASWISKNFSYSGGSRNNSSLLLKSVKTSLASDNPLV
uniref:Uncharacterized protein n=1 Tax=Pipistrellus kuhlii TaxID=59472 RepID=A0A7J7YMD6_PIPKU|nr:hypothetical protein mPipKuh1_010118 [Pipistrellus kuhlii]